MAPPNYLHDIPSVHDKYPTVPTVVGSVVLTRSIQGGTPINRNDLTHAKAVVKVLRGVAGTQN